MNDLIERANTLIGKAKKLYEQNYKLAMRNSELEQELKKLKLTIDNEQLKNDELNNKIKIIKLAQNFGSDTPEKNSERTELKRKINEYLREIDKCIAMLND
jgi:hypothetical protein